MTGIDIDSLHIDRHADVSLQRGALRDAITVHK